MTVGLQERELVHQVFCHNSAICRVGIDRDYKLGYADTKSLSIVSAYEQLVDHYGVG